MVATVAVPLTLRLKLPLRGGGELLRHLDVARLRALEHGVEIAGGLLLELGAGERLRVLRQHQGGRIERVLHGGTHPVRTAVVDGGADGSDERDDGECQQGGYAALAILENARK